MITRFLDEIFGAPNRIRTCGLPLRRRTVATCPKDPINRVNTQQTECLAEG